MLQIISGRFFKQEKRHRYEGKEVLFSNLGWIGSIQTSVAKLEPIGSLAAPDISAYLLSYTNQIEDDGPHPGALIRIGDPEIIKQFMLLGTFGFRAAFGVEKLVVERMCRLKPAGHTDYFLPSYFAPDYFQPQKRATQNDVVRFAKFVDKAIRLPRIKYKALISSLNNFWSALQAFNYSYDLAYSILVYSLESLAQKFDSYEPKWEDYDHVVREKLDDAMLKCSPDVTGKIKDILTNHSHLKAKNRFIGFVHKNLSNSYFIEEAANIRSPIKKSDIERALSNAYQSRSAYVHSLSAVIEQLKVPQIGLGDAVTWAGEPHFTLRGLLRLTTHVIHNFVDQSEMLDHEDFDWRSDLPGIVRLYPAPQYWIWQPDNFTPDQSRQRFNGFLQNLALVISRGDTIIDIRQLLKRIEKVYDQGTQDERKIMLTMYFIFNACVRSEDRMEGYQAFIDKHAEDINGCSIEAMLCATFSGKKWTWSADDCGKEFAQYRGSKHKAGTLEIPALIEIALLAEQATLWLLAGNPNQFKSLLESAILEAPGNTELQRKIREAIEANKEVNVISLISGEKLEGNVSPE